MFGRAAARRRQQLWGTLACLRERGEREREREKKLGPAGTTPQRTKNKTRFLFLAFYLNSNLRSTIILLIHNFWKDER
jgi:hypothetical protein